MILLYQGFFPYILLTGGKKMVRYTKELYGGLLNQGSTVTTAVGGSVPLNPQNLIPTCAE